MLPTTDTPFTLDQLHGLLKTLGIAAANLWGKTRKLNPSSPMAQATEEELLTTLESMQALLNTLVALQKEVK
jgi:hypothetical protein